MSPASRRRNRRAQEQEMQMLMMQAASNPSMFLYIGNPIGLQAKIDEAMMKMQQGIPITDVHIRLTGVQVGEMNTGLLILTIILGAFCIFPLFFMCYDCWKSKVYPSYEIPIQIYQKLQCIISTQTCRTINMQVCDNNFGKEKAQLFFQLLSHSSTQYFGFVNKAVNIDYKENEYSEFVQNMRQIKMLPFQSVIMWWTTMVQ